MEIFMQAYQFRKRTLARHWCAAWLSALLLNSGCQKNSATIDKSSLSRTVSISGITPRNADGLSLSWRICHIDKKFLEIDYRITNHSDASIYVLDLLLDRNADGTFVVNKSSMNIDIDRGSEGETVEFLRGYSDPVAHRKLHWGPASREVLPNSSISGRATIDYPLKFWHYQRWNNDPATLKPTAIILRFGYLINENIQWDKIPFSNGTSIKAPSLSYVILNQKIISSEVIRWPPLF